MKTIAIEGGDACGKATQALELAKRLPGRTLLVSQPWDGRTVALATRDAVAELNYGGWTISGALHAPIRRALRTGWATRWPTLFQLAQVASKLSCHRAIASLARSKRADHIVYDRDSLSAIVYGIATGAARWSVDLAAWLLRLPDVSVVLDRAIPLPEPADRSLDAYETDTALQRRVRFAFKNALIDRDPALASVTDDRVAIVSGHGDPSEVAHSVMVNVVKKLRLRGAEEEIRDC